MTHSAIPNHIKEACAGRTREEIGAMVMATERAVIDMENTDYLGFHGIERLSRARWDLDHLRTYLAHYEEYAR
jgi:hypothetical protein